MPVSSHNGFRIVRFLYIHLRVSVKCYDDVYTFLGSRCIDFIDSENILCDECVS